MEQSDGIGVGKALGGGIAVAVSTVLTVIGKHYLPWLFDDAGLMQGALATIFAGAGAYAVPHNLLGGSP